MKNKKKKKIAYITGTRADFGLMTAVLKNIEKSTELELKIFATGIHLMPEFGETVKIVEATFPGVERVVATFDSDDRIGAAHFCASFLEKITDAFQKYKPDIVLTLGDRPEMLCTAVACLYLRIPIAHVHGGDRSTTVDDSARHAISKLAHLHFPATNGAAKRLNKMGEEKWRIHTVGAPALDVILNTKLPTREKLFKKLGLNPKQNVILVTLHPVSEEMEAAADQMTETLEAVKNFKLPTVIILPHADVGAQKMIEIIRAEKENPLMHIFPSLDHPDFLALEREVVVWVGNSSGAMIESSSFNTPVVNIGSRQFGRERGKNVIDVPCERKKIIKAIDKSLHDRTYLQKIASLSNPWGDGKTGPRIVKILEDIVIDQKLLNKQIAY